MLSLRVARGSRPSVLLRRLLVVTAAGGTGFLLLASLGYALGHPGQPAASGMRLAWCAVPVAATVHLSVSVSRTEPSGQLHSGLAAAGLGHRGLTLLTAATTALSCALGSFVALLVFLHLRGDIPGSPLHATASKVFGGGRPLPPAGVLTLLAVVPVLAAVACALNVRPAGKPAGAAAETGAEADGSGALSAVTAPPGLPWGAALTAIGLAIDVSAGGLARPTGGLLRLPGGLGSVEPQVLAGWGLIIAGMVLAGPGIVHACGRLVAVYRPGALRLLAGRALQEDSRGVGRPLGVLCAVAAGGFAADDLYSTGTAREMGPLTGLAAALVALCAVSAALTALVEAKRTREHSTVSLLQLGASPSLLRGTVALRTGVLLLLVLPLTALIAELAVAPLPA